MALYRQCRKENGYETIMEKERQAGSDGSAGSDSAGRNLERSNSRTGSGHQVSGSRQQTAKKR